MAEGKQELILGMLEGRCWKEVILVLAQNWWRGMRS
jgi:hypothetical protein